MLPFYAAATQDAPSCAQQDVRQPRRRFIFKDARSVQCVRDGKEAA